MSAHTPGPWKFGEMSNEVLDRTGYAVAAVPDSAGEPELERWAIDARLIAAAPELLDALRGCLDLLKADLAMKGEASEWESMAKARAAIAKATGGAR